MVRDGEEQISGGGTKTQSVVHRADEHLVVGEVQGEAGRVVKENEVGLNIGIV